MRLLVYGASSRGAGCVGRSAMLEGVWGGLCLGLGVFVLTELIACLRGLWGFFEGSSRRRGRIGFNLFNAVGFIFICLSPLGPAPIGVEAWSGFVCVLGIWGARGVRGLGFRV